MRTITIAAALCTSAFAIMSQAEPLPSPLIAEIHADAANRVLHVVGANLAGGTASLLLGGNTLPLPILSATPSQIDAALPQGIAAGSYLVSLTLTKPGTKESKTDAFWIGIGPSGAQGPAGPKGAAGPRGATGATGAAGTPGPAGGIGPTGPVGPKGAAGDAGAAGSPGSAGGRGPQGPQGAIGDAGPDGAPGLEGYRGPNGGVGPMGPDGDAGPQGPTGPTGYPYVARIAESVTRALPNSCGDPVGAAAVFTSRCIRQQCFTTIDAPAASTCEASETYELLLSATEVECTAYSAPGVCSATRTIYRTCHRCVGPPYPLMGTLMQEQP